MNTRQLGASLATLLAFAGGCTASSTNTRRSTAPDNSTTSAANDRGDGGPSQGMLVRFGTCDGLLSYLKSQAHKRVTPYGLDGSQRVVNLKGSVQSQDVAEAASNDSSQSGLTSDSGTNVQEPGVDEPDIIKTDGKRLVTLVAGHLTVADISDKSPRVVGTLRLTDSHPVEMMLFADRVVLIGSGGFDEGPSADRLTGLAQTGSVVLTEVSIGGKPRVLNTMSIDGNYLTARLIGNRLRLAVASPPDRMAWVMPTDSDGEQRALESNRALIDESRLSDWLPKVSLNGNEAQELLRCDTVSRPDEFAGFDAVSLVDIDMRAGLGSVPAAQSIIAGGSIVYASTSRMYVAMDSDPNPFLPFDSSEVITSPSPDDPSATPRSAVPEPATAEPTVVPTTNPAPTTVTTPATTSTPTNQTTTTVVDTVPSTTVPVTTALTSTSVDTTVPATSAPTSTSVDTTVPATSAPNTTAPDASTPTSPTTVVHAFAYGPDTPTTYVASGRVPGRLLNQFALDEHEERLRIVTTTTAADGGTESVLRVLEERDGQLVEVGAVGGLGRDEQLYAARIFDDIGFAVTFRKIDPLYVIDLSTPSAPKVTGELKIPGVSTYLHPVGDGLLLGIGADADADGRRTGLKVSVFDVSNPSAPTEVATWVAPNAYSVAEHDHRAFYFADQLAVLPVIGHDDGRSASSAVVLRIGPNSISQVGSITPSEPVTPPTPCRVVDTAKAAPGRVAVPDEDPEVVVQTCPIDEPGGRAGYVCEQLPADAARNTISPLEPDNTVSVDPDQRLEVCHPVRPSFIRMIGVGETMYGLTEQTLQANDRSSLELIASVPVTPPQTLDGVVRSTATRTPATQQPGR